MKIDLYLEDNEVSRLESGGFIKLLMNDGIIITIEMDTRMEKRNE